MTEKKERIWVDKDGKEFTNAELSAELGFKYHPGYAVLDLPDDVSGYQLKKD